MSRTALDLAVYLIIMRMSDGDLILDVLDSGPRIAVDEGSEYRIFRPGISKKAAGRGLHLARQLARGAGGELVLLSRSDSHSALRGAHFRLILPEA